MPGDVCAIPLKSGGYAFGLCCGSDFAFFNVRSDVPVLPDGLQDTQLAFRVPIAKDAPSTGGWQVVGHVEVRDDYAKPEKYLHKPIGSAQCYIYSAGQEEPVSDDECRDLEILSTWFSFHIEERLDDYFAGRDNKYVLAIKKQLGI